MKTLTTNRCMLTQMAATDLPEILEMYKEPNIHQYIPHLQNQTKEEHLKTLHSHIDYCNNNNGLGIWTVRDKTTKAFIGLVNLNYSNAVKLDQIGAQFSSAYWGKGYGTETLEALKKHGFEDLGLEAIYGIVSKAHVASQKMLKNIGMTFWKSVDFDDEKEVQIYVLNNLA